MFEVYCQICERYTAKVRESEAEIAKTTGRAHVDCIGHGHYRDLTVSEMLMIKAPKTSSPEPQDKKD